MNEEWTDGEHSQTEPTKKKLDKKRGKERERERVGKRTRDERQGSK